MTVAEWAFVVLGVWLITSIILALLIEKSARKNRGK